MDRNLDGFGAVITPQLVALRKESVDRNRRRMPFCRLNTVALRKESVDRNTNLCVQHGESATVALRKESVDRNGLGFRYYRDDVSSLSVRRAWIEMMEEDMILEEQTESLSVRRAWIEISITRIRTPIGCGRSP